MSAPKPATTLADLAPALARVRRVLRKNDDRHRGAWRTQPVADHIRHAADHLAVYEAGDRVEDHLGHAATRCLMALTRASEGAG